MRRCFENSMSANHIRSHGCKTVFGFFIGALMLYFIYTLPAWIQLFSIKSLSHNLLLLQEYDHNDALYFRSESDCELLHNRLCSHTAGDLTLWSPVIWWNKDQMTTIVGHYFVITRNNEISLDDGSFTVFISDGRIIFIPNEKWHYNPKQ